ncbi:MAG: hypothetical protein IJ493_07290 [Clostridia bacterium]|nr:hypothetical protein [Clostridia bacterium]
MSTKRTIALLLSALLTASCAACGSADTPSDTTPSDTTGTDTTAADTSNMNSIEARRLVDDELPDKNYNGDEFVIVIDDYAEEFTICDEQTGDVVDDAVYSRNRDIEDRFNIKLVASSRSYEENPGYITNSIQAGDDEIDLICTHVVYAGKMLTSDFFRNWYDIEYVDFDKPWWAPSTSEDLSYNDVCILAVGDFAMTAIARTYCVFYNKNLAEDYQLGDIYGLVNDGEWTVEKAIALTKDVYTDLDNDGSRSDGDFYGYASDSKSNINAYLWAFDNPVIRKNGTGELELVFHTEKVSDIVTTLCSMFNDNEGIVMKNDWDYGVDLFSQSQSIFANGQLTHAASVLRNMEDDYGIIPLPKWDEAQKNYYTMVDGGHSILAVPVTVADTERVGIITEALNAESYKTVVPAYYETALKAKYARDDETIAMLDLIMDSRIFDMGYVYDAWKGASFLLQELVAANNTNFESTWASKESSITEHYQTVIDYFVNFGE